MIAREKIYKLVEQELDEANEKYPLFHSPHEAYAVLKEEVDELEHEMEKIWSLTDSLWVAVKSDRNIESYADRIYAYAVMTVQEAIQVAAMCDKIKQSELYNEKEG